MARYAPPAHDITMFLYLVQNKEFRDKKQDELLEYYYSQLKEELQVNDLEVENVLPWKDFLESYEHYYEFGVLTSALCWPLVLLPPEVASQFLSSTVDFDRNMRVDRSDLYRESYFKDETYRTRITESMGDLINDFIL